MSLSARARASLSSRFLASNAVVWVSALIVMGIMSYWFSAQNNQPDFNVYMLVVSILTVVFFLAAFLLEDNFGYLFLFNLIFSYLWLAVVVFTAFLFSNASRQAQTVEAFSFLAFFALLFNVGFNWYTGILSKDQPTETTQATTSPSRV
ncbi:hypothetical protein GQ53DRAFT_861037 [Thozetella sp. PMI_491]|nr:hypothetical protein GQ53DRAFT_861037 [Thozetella sp. PMI_491]